MFRKNYDITKIINIMPKQSKKTSITSNKKSQVSEAKSLEQGPISNNKSGQILIKILAKPGAKQNSITDICTEHVGIQINAPPVEGEANSELIKFLSKILALPKSIISLEKGSKSRQKTILISDSSIKIEDILEKLKSEENS